MSLFCVPSPPCVSFVFPSLPSSPFFLVHISRGPMADAGAAASPQNWMMSPRAWRRLITVQIAAQTRRGAPLSWTGRSGSGPPMRMRVRKKRKTQEREEEPPRSPEVHGASHVRNHWTSSDTASSPSDTHSSVGAGSQRTWDCSRQRCVQILFGFPRHRSWLLCNYILFHA